MPARAAGAGTTKCEFAERNSGGKKKTLLKEIGDLKRPISGRRLNGLIVPFSRRQNSMEDDVFGFGGREEPQPEKGGIIKRDTITISNA